MRRFDNFRLAPAAGAFALGILLTMLCHFKLALFIAALLLILLCKGLMR